MTAASQIVPRAWGQAWPWSAKVLGSARATTLYGVEPAPPAGFTRYLFKQTFVYQDGPIMRTFVKDDIAELPTGTFGNSAVIAEAMT
jgi:hypothetical protein